MAWIPHKRLTTRDRLMVSVAFAPLALASNPDPTPTFRLRKAR